MVIFKRDINRFSSEVFTFFLKPIYLFYVVSKIYTHAQKLRHDDRTLSISHGLSTEILDELLFKF